MGEVQRGVSNDLQTGSEAQETEIRQNGTGKNRCHTEQSAMTQWYKIIHEVCTTYQFDKEF